jgi:putative addiction module component (TIGR02574 family)
MATINPMRFTQSHRFGAAVSRDSKGIAANSRSKVVLHQRQVLLMSPKLLTYEQGANMNPNVEELAKETMALDIEDRALLAGKLLLSLDEPTPSEVERLWLDEAERRLESYRTGKVQGIPADEVFRRAISELS